MLVAQLVDALRATIRYVNAWLSRNRTVARLRLVFTPRTLLLSLLALQDRRLSPTCLDCHAATRHDPVTAGSYL
eukprot:6182519-Pleurochrysis_carterae.AAC.7